MPDDYGQEPKRYFIPIDRCRIDLRAQRRIRDQRSQRKIKQIAAEFSWPKLGSIVVTTTPDGWFNVIDGQKRIEAIRLINQQPDRPSILFVPAEVNEEMSIEAQAATFVGINEDRHPVNIFALHRVKLTAGDDGAHAIEALAAGAGCRIPISGPSTNAAVPGDIICLKTLRNLCKRRDPAVAAAIVGAVADAYRDEVRGMRRTFLDAAERILCDGAATRAELTAAFQCSAAAELNRLAKGLGSSRRQADVIVAELRRRIDEIRKAEPPVLAREIGALSVEQKTEIATLVSRRASQLREAANAEPAAPIAEERAGPPCPKDPAWGSRNPGIASPKAPEPTPDRRAAELAAMAEYERTRGVTRCAYAAPEVMDQPRKQAAPAGFSMLRPADHTLYTNRLADRRRDQGRAFKE